jgi:cell wall-associated NlpC family hydrolase
VLLALGARPVAAQAVASAPAVTEIRGTVAGTDVVRSARKYLGVPYRLGGTTPRAFDCSGFVKWVFAEHGIAMPRTAREQAGVGDAPRFDEELQPGDLLFFYGPQGAGHIGIYAGNDSIIHASSTGRRVKVDRLGGRGTKRTWFGRRLIAVRRVLPMEGVFRVAGSVPWERRGPDPRAVAVAAEAGATPAQP